VTAIALVYVLPSSGAESDQSVQLPRNVAYLRDAILAAAHSGDIEELKPVFGMGALPDLGVADAGDPIKALKGQSADGQGREILAALINLLEMPPATKPIGRDIENNSVYVWPYLAAKQLDKLTPSEEVDLYRLVSPAKASEMHEKKRWLWWCLAVAADGTWLTFKQIK
jgi:hypothetical protein